MRPRSTVSRDIESASRIVLDATASRVPSFRDVRSTQPTAQTTATRKRIDFVILPCDFSEHRPESNFGATPLLLEQAASGLPNASLGGQLLDDLVQHAIDEDAAAGRTVILGYLDVLGRALP